MYVLMATTPTPTRRRKIIAGERVPVETTTTIFKKILEDMKKETKIKKRPEELKIKRPEEIFRLKRR